MSGDTKFPLDDKSSRLEVEKKLGVDFHSFERAFFKTGGTINREIIIDSDENVLFPLSAGNSLKISDQGKLTVEGNLKIIEF